MASAITCPGPRYPARGPAMACELHGPPALAPSFISPGAGAAGGSIASIGLGPPFSTNRGKVYYTQELIQTRGREKQGREKKRNLVLVVVELDILVREPSRSRRSALQFINKLWGLEARLGHTQGRQTDKQQHHHRHARSHLLPFFFLFSFFSI